MNNFLLAALIFLILAISGYSLSLIFLTQKLRSKSFWLLPWLGLVLIINLGTILNIARIAMSKSFFSASISGAMIIVFVIVFQLVVAILNRQRQRWLVLWNKNGLFVGLAVLVISFVLLNFFKAPWLDTSGEFLIDNTFSGQLVNGGKVTRVEYQMGSQVLVAFLTRLFKADFNQVFRRVFYLNLALLPLLVFDLFRLVKFKPNQLRLVQIIFTGVYLLVILFGWQFLQLQLRQVIFIGLFLLMVILLTSYYQSCPKNIGYKSVSKEFNQYDFLIGLALAAIAATHSTGLVWSLLLFVSVTILNSVRRRDCFSYLVFFKSVLISFLINPVTFGLALRLGGFN